jgi:hypothetical protein
LFFRSPFEQACSIFVIKVLTRSEPHLMFLGAYLGIGFVLVAQTAMDAAANPPSVLPDTDWLAIPLMTSFFVLSGLRFVFDIPAALDANWVFRASVECPYPEPRAIARRLMLSAVLPWQVLVLAPVTAQKFGWSAGLLHTGCVIALSVLFVDFLVRRFRKIPFTCNTEPDIKQLLRRILASVLGVLVAVPFLAAFEHWMIAEPLRFAILVAVLAYCWRLLHKQRKEMFAFELALTFEDTPEPQFELLKI